VTASSQRLSRAADSSTIEMMSCGAVFNTSGWQQAWAQCTVESVCQRRLLTADGVDEADVRLPLYATADSALWRGYEDDAGMTDVLAGPITYASSLYAISSPINRCRNGQVVCLVDEALDQARAWQTTALAVTNVEPGSVLTQLRQQRPPDVVVRLDATCRRALPGCVEDFLAGLGKSARSELRRRSRRAEEQDVIFHERTGAAAAAILPSFCAVTAETAQRHGNKPLYDLHTLKSVLDVPGARLLTAEHGRDLLAGTLSVLHDGCLVVWAGGALESALHTHHSYIYLLGKTVHWAIDHGCCFMDFGRGTFDFKQRHGFHRTNLYTLYYLTDPASQQGSRLAKQLAEVDARIHEFLGF